jgi:transitional endoplasmic reticulum ATPase
MTEKARYSMPPEIGRSAWGASKALPARCLQFIVYQAADWSFVWATFFATHIFMLYLLVALIPVDAIREGFPFMRRFIAWTYAALALFGVFFHWLSLQMVVPRADKEYPILDVTTPFENTLKTLSYHVMGFAGFLLIAYNLDWLSLPARNTNLWYGVATLTLGAVSFVFSTFPPMYGLNVPTEGEIAYVNQQIYRAVPSSQQSAAAPAPQAAPQQAAVEEYATPVQARQPRSGFESIYGMQAVKDKLLPPAQRIIAERVAGVEAPGNGILLHGEPGNGKTVFAEALAGELKVPFVQLTYGDISSKWLGEMPRLIANCFAYAKQHAPCVFFIDEIDSFIRSRDGSSNNAEDMKVTNTLLTEIVNLRDHRVVLMGATNFLANLDGAAIREGRFDYKVEITPPDELARIGLLTNAAKKYAIDLVVDEADMLSVAQRWSGFSVSRLVAVAKALPDYARDAGVDHIAYKDWMGALRAVQGRNGRVPKNTKSLSELVLQDQTRDALKLVASRLTDVARIEAMGGTLPNGVLFHGPAGTGKTAAARALAKECGWAFLSVSGPDLIADREKLSKLYAEAKDIRPTIIFIDEADEILRDRQYSATPDLTNRMLVLMDGTDEKVKDVVWIAATNHPEQIDPALLRAGRFTEKVLFTTPPQDQVPRHVAGWLKAKSVALEAGLDAFDIAAMLEGQTIANIEGVLQYALNVAISNTEGAGSSTVTIKRQEIETALRVVAGEA